MHPRHLLLALALTLTLSATFWPLQEEENAEDLRPVRPPRPAQPALAPAVSPEQRLTHDDRRHDSPNNTRNNARNNTQDNAADAATTADTLHANLFPAQTWQPPAPPRPLPQEETPPEPQPMPEVPYTYLGRWQEDGKEVTYLLRQERLQAITPGMLLDHVWQVQKIERERITLLYLPRQQEAELRLTP